MRKAKRLHRPSLKDWECDGIYEKFPAFVESIKRPCHHGFGLGVVVLMRFAFRCNSTLDRRLLLLAETHETAIARTNSAGVEVISLGLSFGLLPLLVHGAPLSNSRTSTMTYDFSFGLRGNRHTDSIIVAARSI